MLLVFRSLLETPPAWPATPAIFTLTIVNATVAGQSIGAVPGIPLVPIAMASSGASAATPTAFALVTISSTASAKSAATPTSIAMVVVSATLAAKGSTDTSPALFGLFVYTAQSSVLPTVSDDRLSGGSSGASPGENAGYPAVTPPPSFLPRVLEPRVAASGSANASPIENAIEVCVAVWSGSLLVIPSAPEYGYVAIDAATDPREFLPRGDEMDRIIAALPDVTVLPALDLTLPDATALDLEPPDATTIRKRKAA